VSSVRPEREQALKARSHVLTLGEGGLDSRLRDRDRTIEDLPREGTGFADKSTGMIFRVTSNHFGRNNTVRD